VTRRLRLEWPDRRPFIGREERPIRILAASDERDRTLEQEVNRRALEPVDLVVGAGDLSPDWLAFLGDAFLAPLIYVRGNHDVGGPWPRPPHAPEPCSGFDDATLPGIPILALPWPTWDGRDARRDEWGAWRQVAGLGLARVLRPLARTIVLSHVPPRDVGDTPDDPYHVGFAAYAFLARRVRPSLWLHGHTSLAAQTTWRVVHGPTTVVNVTGSVLVELTAPAAGEQAELAEISASG
jgi:hypothetical protein